MMKLIHIMVLAAFLTITAHANAASEQEVMKADTNGDGKVTFEEYKAAYEAEMLERFKRKDINQDGVIDLEEKVIAKEKKKEEAKAKKQEARETLREKYREERKKRRRHLYKSQ